MKVSGIINYDSVTNQWSVVGEGGTEHISYQDVANWPVRGGESVTISIDRGVARLLSHGVPEGESVRPISERK